MTPIPTLPAVSSVRHTDATYAKAQELEAAFLAEMLAHAGLDGAQDSFSGGMGEAQFASFLRQEQARQMAEAGGLGIAEMIFRTMTGTEVTDDPAA